MSLYTTPLQLGYFFSLLMWILLNVRGFREQRLSDKLLGWCMFILAMELQDYTFGFAGINVLWNELNGFPRGVSLIFGPVVYFYFRAQVNRSFRIEKKHLWHFAPYVFYFSYEISAFIQGPEAVQARYESALNDVMGYVMRLAMWGSYIFYLTRCLKIFRKYKVWSTDQFSNTELINFSWFRNFVYAMSFWLLFREIMNIMDAFMDLDFYQDWWWNLALVVVAYYIGLAGYTQKQPTKIHFEIEPEQRKSEAYEGEKVSQKQLKEFDPEKTSIAEKLKTLMANDRLYLQPDLNLQELGQYLQTNPVQLSASINQVFGQNFNDYINTLRIDEFIRLYKEDESNRFTLLSIALDSGFNSKATFNRAFKKIKGSSPKQYLEEINQSAY